MIRSLPEGLLLGSWKKSLFASEGLKTEVTLVEKIRGTPILWRSENDPQGRD